MQTHRHLAVGQFAQRSAVLALHPHRVLAFFRETGIVENPEGFSLLLAGGDGQLLPDWFPRPGALTDKLLQGLFVALGQARGHGADAFALAIQQQTPHIDLAPVATVLPPERGQPLLQVRFQAGATGIQLLCRHTLLDAARQK
jgi:hypothetical protein